MGKKRKHAEDEQDRKDYDLPAKHMNTSHIRSNERRLVIILEGAQLETVKVNMLGLRVISSRLLNINNDDF